jgi:hypothetical protein
MNNYIPKKEGGGGRKEGKKKEDIPYQTISVFSKER